MRQVISVTKRFVRDQEGATLVEYGLLIGLLSLIAVATVVVAARYVNGAFSKVESDMANYGMPSN